MVIKCCSFWYVFMCVFFSVISDEEYVWIVNWSCIWRLLYCVINLLIDRVLFFFLVVLMCFFCFLIFFWSVVILCLMFIILGVMLDIIVDMVFSLVFFWVRVVFNEKVICWNVVFLVVGLSMLYLDWKFKIFVFVCWSFCLMILCLFLVKVSFDFVKLLLMLLINFFVLLIIVWLIICVYFVLKVWVWRLIMEDVELMFILIWFK